MEKFEIESKQGYKIKCHIISPNSTNFEKYIIMCHGFASNKESSTYLELSRRLKEKGYATVGFDFIGHGESEVSSEKLSIESCINDIDSVYDYILKQNPNAKISLFASSFGAYSSLLFIGKKKRKLEKIILRCTAVEMDYIFEKELINGTLEEMYKNGFAFAGFNNMKIPASFYQELKENNIYKIYEGLLIKALMIHGDMDKTAPVEHVIRFANEHKDEIKLEIIKGADHRFEKQGETEKLLKLVIEYIEG